jgi:hypothetical protein
VTSKINSLLEDALFAVHGNPVAVPASLRGGASILLSSPPVSEAKPTQLALKVPYPDSRCGRQGTRPRPYSNQLIRRAVSLAHPVATTIVPVGSRIFTLASALK